MTWNDGTTHAVDVDPNREVSLGTHEFLVLPVDPGDRVQLRGDIEAVGLGTGALELPDAITWLPLSPSDVARERDVLLPTWSSARFLVVRGAGASAFVSARAAARQRTPMDWYRLDEAMDRWLRGPVASPPPAPSMPGAAALLRWVAALAAILDTDDRSVAAERDEAAADWLMARYLDASLAIRPLDPPFFAKPALTLVGGRLEHALPALADASAWQTASARTADRQLTVTDADADVVLVTLRAKATPNTEVVVRTGASIDRVVRLSVPARAVDPNRWTHPVALRVVLPAGAPTLTIEVAEGTVAAAVEGYRMRSSVVTSLSTSRNREQELERTIASAREGGSAVLERLATASAMHDQASVRALTEMASTEGVPSGLRALALVEAAGLVTTRDVIESSALSALSALSDATHPAQGVGGGPTARDLVALERHLLERLMAMHPDRLGGPSADLRARLAPEGEADDEAVVAVLAHALASEDDGARPLAALWAERYAASHPELADAAPRAHDVWAREAPWRALDASQEAQRFEEIGPPADEGRADGRCALRGPGGLRWTVLGPGKTAVDVAAPGGSHARVVLASLASVVVPDSRLEIDGVAIELHEAAGVDSVVAVAPGVRQFDRPGARSMLARIPREGDAPCATLRDTVGWVRVGDEGPPGVVGRATFSVPSPGRATVARFVVHPADVASRSQRLVVDVGTARFEAWMSGEATGAIEVPVPADTEAITVSSTAPIRVRASARLRRLPAPAVSAVVRAPTAPLTIDELLERVRAATRSLRNATVTEQRTALRRERGEALTELAFDRFAAFDRGGPLPKQDEDGAHTPVEILSLAPSSPAIVALGLAATIPPLPLPANGDALERGRAAYRAKNPAAALEALRDAAASSANADALLLGIVAERAGDAQTASAAFERVGLAHDAQSALTRAASLAADVALASGDRRLSMHAFVLAQLAADRGGSGTSAFARFGTAITWLTPARAESAAGTALLDASPPRSTSPSLALASPLGVRVRRALLDAGEDAVLVAEGERLQVRVKRPTASTITIHGACHAFAADDRCALEATIDGAHVHCDAGLGSHGYQTRCTIPIPAGDHRVEVRPATGEDAIGALVVRDADGAVLSARVVSAWTEIDKSHPLELAFAGPTVIRLRARGPADASLDLAWSIAPGAAASEGTEGTWRIAASRDPAASRAAAAPGTPNPPGEEAERRLAVRTLGPHVLRIATSGPRALLRIDVAAASGLPRARDSTPPIAPAAVAFVGTLAELRRAPIGEDLPASIATFSVQGRFVDGALSAGDRNEADRVAATRFAELSLWLQRELVDGRAWMAGSAMARFRSGAPSLGTEVSFDLAPTGWLPGGFVRGRLVTQVAEITAVGAHGTLGPQWSFPITDSLAFAPVSVFTAQYVDTEARAIREADADVYTPYAETHPLFATLGARLLSRPFADGAVRFGLSARFVPTAGSEFDRVDAALDVDLLPGRDVFPWLNLGYLASLRPGSADRSEYLRQIFGPRLTGWSWLRRGHRVLAELAVDALVDAPAPTGPSLRGSLALRYTYSGSRGLRDVPPRNLVFRDRLEEDSGVVERARPAVESSW